MSSTAYVAFSDTATSPATATRVLNPTPLNFKADWRVLSSAPGEIVLTSIHDPVDSSQKLRIAYSQVADAWKGTGYTKNTNATASDKGVSVLVQYTGALKGDNATVDGGQNYYPFSVHFVIKIPVTVATSENIVGVVLRALGALYETGAATPDTRIQSLFNGAIQPSDL